MNVDYFQLLATAAPELLVTLGALLALSADVAFMRGQPIRERLLIGGAVGGMSCLAAIFYMFMIPENVNLLNGMLVVDPLSRLVKTAILILSVFTLVMTFETRFTEHAGEYVALVLMATVGLMFLAGTEDLLMIFVSLELASLSLYILTAFNKGNINSSEAALKYFLFGGVAAAFTLFGLSLVYGLTGETNLKAVALALKGQGLEPLLMAAIIMTVTGFGFKIAAVPFHLWAPDAYQGAPTPSAALIASGSKVASFLVLAKVMIVGFAGAEGSGGWRNFAPGWMPVLALLAVFSVLLGNLAAIAQSDVRRLLAYSAVAHAGYALLGVIAGNGFGVASIVYYMITYGLTAVGAFGVVALVEERTGGSRLTDFAGLVRTAPFASLCMMIFMLSLAGIPPLAGFFGKFYVFTAAVKADPKNLGLLWLVIFAIAMSAVSLYYYLQVLKQIFVVEPPVDPNATACACTPLSCRIALGLLALAVIVLGCAPDLLVGRIVEAVRLAGM